VTLKASGADAAVYFDGEVPAGAPGVPAQIIFDARPGPATLVIGVEKGGGEPIDVETREFDLADPAGAPVAISTPRVYRARNPFELRRLAAEESAPTAAREFERTDRLFLRFDAYAPDGATPTVAVRLLNRQGQKLTDLTVTAKSAPQGFEVDLPLSSLAAGTYVIRVEARAGDATAAEHLAFVLR
jgi:hypothetical protein